MKENDEVITATISLTRNQWEFAIYCIMNEAGMIEVGLPAQAGREAVNRMVSDLINISTAINEATGVNVDLSGWKFYVKGETNGNLQEL